MSTNVNGNVANTKRTIVISERDNIAALIEDGKVVEFFIHRGDMLLGDVYLATVENILPSIDAAFVNLGADRMGFLHASDVPGKGELKDRLEPKQKILVQIMKEPTGHKGPRVSTSLSLPGRFLVLMPEEKGISISRKILSPKERSRIKSIVSLLKPPGIGVILRTEAENQSEEEIKEDMETLLEKWQNIVTTADSVSPPSLIHRDQDLLYRVIREACNDVVDEIFIDTPFGQHRVNQLIQTWNLGKNIKVTVYKGNDSLLVSKGIDKEIKQALQSKVNLPSGGYLYIQPTEALTVIDVNSGRFTSSQTQSETIRQTNIEAISEIARQLRLRNIGGMIVVDFIDMDNRVDQLTILEAFEMALQPDKSKPQIGQLSDLGLVELTRHRQGQSLSEIFTKKCPACNGVGAVLEDLNFAAPGLEVDIRSRNPKAKILPRLKPVSSPNKTAETNQNQKNAGLKPAGNQPQQAQNQQNQQNQQKQQAHHQQLKHQHQQNQHKPQPKQPEIINKIEDVAKAPAEETPPEASYPVIQTETPDNIENITFDKLRKIFKDKKYFPEISKIIRFTGVPLKTARESFGEEVNQIDVFTIISEMDAAFARASQHSAPQQTVRVTPIQPAEPVKKPVVTVEETRDFQKEVKKEKPAAAETEFTGRYGISSNGENFEDLYEIIDEDESASEIVENKPQVVEEVPEADESDETDESEEAEESDEAEKGEAADAAGKKPAKRGRKTSKPGSARKKPGRGRPKSK